MKAIAWELQKLIDEFVTPLHLIPGDKLSSRPAPGKWSRKELIGHLIDSAQNNIRRFIVSQYEGNPRIMYNHDKWVSINNYQQTESTQLIDLWYLLNKQAVNILNNIPAEISHTTCQTETLHTIEWLAKDYIKHLRHHIHQVLGLEPFAYP